LKPPGKVRGKGRDLTAAIRSKHASSDLTPLLQPFEGKKKWINTITIKKKIKMRINTQAVASKYN